MRARSMPHVAVRAVARASGGRVRVVGVDIGGTFTDFMLYDTESGGRARPQGPLDARRSGPRARRRARRALRPGGDRARPRSTPSSTGRPSPRTPCSSIEGAECGLITTEGFRDVVHIGRHQRPQHYSIMQDIPWQARPFVQAPPPQGRRGAGRPAGRRGARGARRGRRPRRGARAAARPVSRRSPSASSSRYLNPEHERRAAEIVARGAAGRVRDLERGHLPAVPRVRALHDRVHERLRRTRDGPLPRAARRRRSPSDGVPRRAPRDDVERRRRDARSRPPQKPVTLLLSGPAAGVLGGALGRRASTGGSRLITFDMGGTSADIGIVTERGDRRGVRARHRGRGLPAARADDRRPHDRGRRRARSPTSTRAARSASGPRSAGASPGPALLRARRRRSRRSPTRTSCSAGSTRTASSAAR